MKQITAKVRTDKSGDTHKYNKIIEVNTEFGRFQIAVEQWDSRGNKSVRIDIATEGGEDFDSVCTLTVGESGLREITFDADYIRNLQDYRNTIKIKPTDRII